MTNIADLKEKLTTYNKASVLKHVNTNIIYRFTSEKSTADIFNDGAIFQHSQDARTITALLEIIEDMQQTISAQCRRSKETAAWIENHHFENDEGDGDWYVKSTEPFNELEIMREECKQTLTATEQKLKKLTEEK